MPQMQGRRNFSAEFKAQVVLEILTGAKSVAQAAREYSIKPELLSRWKSDFVTNASKLFENSAVARASDPQAERIAELERLVGLLLLQRLTKHQHSYNRWRCCCHNICAILPLQTGGCSDDD